MSKHPFRYIDHEICVAYYQDGLSPRHAARIRAYLEVHPAEARRARIDAELERAIAQPLEGVLQEPVPPRLRVETQSAAKLWSGRLSLAATIALSVACGWWLGGRSAATDFSPTFTERVISAAQQPVRQPIAQVVVTPKPTAVSPPDLSLQGYRLVQQRRLGSAKPALIEFVYRNAGGRQLRIYAETDSDHQAALSVTSQDGLSLAQWREGDTRYALVGDMPKLSLRNLAQAARIDSANGRNMLAGTGQWQAIQPDDGHYGMRAQQPPPVAEDVGPVSIHRDYTVQPGHR